MTGLNHFRKVFFFVEGPGTVAKIIDDKLLFWCTLPNFFFQRCCGFFGKGVGAASHVAQTGLEFTV